MQICTCETLETFHGCFSVLVSAFYVQCATAEVKCSFLSVLFLFYFNCGGTITKSTSHAIRSMQTVMVYFHRNIRDFVTRRVNHS